MDTGLLHLHSVLRWVVLILLLLSIYKAYTGWQSKKAFSNGDRKTWLFTLISSHLILLVGLYQLALGRFGIFKYTLPAGESVMKNRFLRFYWIEHPVAMILAVIFITAGYQMAKKQVSDEVKYRKAFTFFLLALLLILAAIPWPFRTDIGRPLFPGM